MKKKSSKKIVILTAILAVVLVLAIGGYVYVQDYYRADPAALEVLSQEDHASFTLLVTDQQIVFAPDDPIAGLIFYPGGKVQYESYAPLMESLAEHGVLCVLVHMPWNLAVLDVNAADGIREQYPVTSDWYLAGHSLGGAMAASYAAKHQSDYRGLILLAAYSTADLIDSDLKVLSVYGTEDGVMNRESYDKYASNLPEGSTETVIQGGCHAYFGSYGPQDGDGDPLISREEQIKQTADAILSLIRPQE